MNIDREIQEQEMKLKALHYERDQRNMAKASEAGMGLLGTNQACTIDPRWTPEGIRDIVSYHAPTPHGIDKITAIRTATEMFLRAIVDNCPECADRSAALRHAREAMMTANASIVLGGRV